MANPQADKHYIKISTELFEAIMVFHFPGNARMVFDYIIRMTYGYNRKKFETTHHRIAAALHIHRQLVSRSLRWLIDRRLVNGTQKVAVNLRNSLTILEIQKDYEKWNHSDNYGTQKVAVKKPNNLKLYNESRSKLTAHKRLPCTQKVAVNGTQKVAAIIDITKDTKTNYFIDGTQKVAVSAPAPPQKTIRKSVSLPKYTPPTGAQLKANGNPWIDADAWDDFTKHRTEIKKPLTEQSVKKSIKFLSAFKTRQSEIIETSIRCGWTGLFEPKKSFQSSDDVDGPRMRILEAPKDGY